jgi:hypothetical protein
MARVTTLTQETTLRQVTDRLYGTLAARDRARVEKALLEANPHLATPDALAPGTVVRVPVITGFKARTAAVSQDPMAELRDAVSAGLEQFRANLSTHLDAAGAELDAQNELLKDRTVAAEIKRVGASDVAKRLTEALRERAKAVAEVRKRQEALFKRIDADLRGLDEG